MDRVFGFIGELFIGDGLLIAAGAYVVGVIVKRAAGAIGGYIPLIGGVFGAVMGLIMLGADASSAIRGLCLGWAATGGYETVKGLKPRALQYSDAEADGGEDWPDEND